MELSNDLISKFVKITNDKTDVKQETTVYGTAVEYNDKMYVKLDGSDLLTPISTTTDTKAGERVTVMIKDHTATVTGNISSPAARTEVVQEVAAKVIEMETVVADKVSTKDLEAESARIDALVTENTTIKNTLTATNANIVNLQTENATITQKLTANEADITKLEADIANIDAVSTEELEAVNADIHNLEATYATFNQTVTQDLEAVDARINNLDSKYATIESLDVEKGRIDDLEATSLTATSATITDLQADVANIDTLIFGSASGNVIQSSFSNAVVAQLGNAMIKSAMIESVAADKITSGDIITNNVRVLSEDGKLIISDETIQISDENRVRVQIGKDASNDYSINIWDENGNLMFSEGGITDSAIKEAIIRNDMVSEDANISAKKLDIGSLFTTMNEDGSHTLNSSKVLIDSENQTLNVAFASMTTNVTTAQATADTAQSSANNANSVAANALSAATNAQDDIDNLEIGGRNLLAFSNIVLGGDTLIESNGTKYLKLLNVEQYGGIVIPFSLLETSTDYILHFDITCLDGVGSLGGHASSMSTSTIYVDGTQHAHGWTSGNVTLGQNTKKHIEVYFKTVSSIDGMVNPNIYIQPQRTSTSVVNLTYTIENLKLEKGNKATDWTPAPEDVDTDIASAQTTADEANSKADTNASNIASVTTTVTTQGTDISVLQGQISSKIWQQDITTAVTNIEIGGRNLLKDTATPITPDGTGGSNYAYGTYFLSTSLEANQEYMVSADVEVLAGTVTNVTVLVIDSTTTIGCGSTTLTITNGRIEGVLKPNSNYASATKVLFYAGISGSTSGNKVKFSNVKMEKGNKATDWTPAPEDMATTTEVNTLSTKYSELEQTVDGLTSTVASHTTEISKKADGTTVATVSDKVSQLEQNIEGFKTTVSDTYSTKENLSDAIANLEIGGRNWYKSNQSVQIIAGTYTDGVSYQPTFTRPQDECPNGFYMVGNKYTVGVIRIENVITSNGDWTVSFWVRGSQNTSVGFNIDVCDKGSTRVKTTADNTWSKVELTVTVDNYSADVYHFIDFSSIQWAYIFIKDFKVEKGNKATDWTPAPEDVDAEISSLEGRMTTAETSITQTSTDITSLATRTTNVETTAANAYASTRRKSGTINLTDTSKYNIDTYYPVVCSTSIASTGYHLHEVNVQLNSGSKPSWSTHDGGFTCNLSCRMKAYGWGTVDSSTLGWLDDFSYAYCDKMPAYITQNTNASRAIFYLRGGGTYFLFTNYDCTWTVYTSDITINSSTFSPTTTPSNHAKLVNNWETVSRIGTAETKIIQNADSISSLADKTVVLENKFGEYPTIAEMNSAIVQKADSITSSVAATYTTKIDSAYAKLGNLIKNGYGEYLDASGWSGTTFTRGDCPEGCHGYFCNGMSIDNIPYDPTKIYDYEYYVRLHSGRSGSNYFSIYPLDIDGNLISPYNLPIAVSNMAYLAQDLKNGDTVVYFDDLSNWNTSVTQTYQRSFLIYGYKDSTGYTYPDGTYSRNSHMEVYADNSDVDLTNNTITLKSAWTGGTIASGTCIGQCSHGSTYVYFGQTGGITNTDWVFRSGEIIANPEGDIDKRRLAYAKSFRVYLYNNVADYAGICIREQTIDKLGRTAAEEAKDIADEAKVTATSAQSSIEQLADQISMLVVNGDGGSMMTQTADGGWQFNMGTVNTAIDNLNSDVEDIKDQADATDADVSNLDKRVAGLETVTEYIHIGTYTEPDTGAVVPSIDLGEGDSDFKLKITNKEIIFTNGSTDPAAHIDSVDQIFEIKQAEIKTDLRIGNIVFAKRPNGNVGISWKEV